jgi:hypothetical protein
MLLPPRLVRPQALVALVALMCFASGCSAPRQSPSTPSPSPAYTTLPNKLIVQGGTPVSMRVETRALGVNPDGHAQFLAIAHFYDAKGSLTRILANSDLDWRPSRGAAQWQNRMRYGEPSAIVSVDTEGPITLRVHPNAPVLPDAVVQTDTRAWSGPRVVAGAAGPYLAQIGWFPRSDGNVQIDRLNAKGRWATLATLPAGSSTYRDGAVKPDTPYRYRIARDGIPQVAFATVRTPPAPPSTTTASVSGVGMWMVFTTNPSDDIYYANLHPKEIVRQAVDARIRFVELRVAYGAMWQITPEAKPVIDAIVDGLEEHGIRVIAWTVPRAPDFDDVQTAADAIDYTTAGGRHFDGIAVDAERGDEFVASGRDAIAEYYHLLRAALGPRYLVVATVEDPAFEHLTEADYPYREVAQNADVLQPMAYWRMMHRTPTTPDRVRVLLEQSYETLRAFAQPAQPISIGGQTADGPNGRPPADEITASLSEAKTLGALGVCFFAWNDTAPSQWTAIKRRGAF